MSSKIRKTYKRIISHRLNRIKQNPHEIEEVVCATFSETFVTKWFEKTYPRRACPNASIRQQEQITKGLE